MISNWNDKNKYVVHIRTLQFYLKHGLKLKKIHRAIKFEPKEALRPHIGCNSEKRKNATDNFENDIFKLLNNALTFMVMIENKRHVRAQQKYSKTKNSIRNYNQILESNEVIHRSFSSIQSQIHKIYRSNSTKVSLNNYETKRYWTNSVDGLAWGHYKLHDFRNE